MVRKGCAERPLKKDFRGERSRPCEYSEEVCTSSDPEVGVKLGFIRFGKESSVASVGEKGGK